MTNVFLSYARADDEPFVRRLYEDLTAAGLTAWWDRVSMPSRALTFLQEIRDAIDASERLVLVVGPAAVASDYVRAEWQYAFAACKAVTPLLRLGDYTQIPPELARHHCPDVRAARSYEEALVEVLRVLGEPIPPLGALHNVPSLPAHFLPREADLAFLRETLLADVNRPTVITSARQTAALQGMGGVGKSVLAAAFCRSCEARHAFGDGIVWVTLGQWTDLRCEELEARLLRAITSVAAALGDDPREYVDLERARGRLPKLLAGKACLLVLDDAWDVAHVEPFANALGTRCRLLVTTRDGGLASALGAQEQRLDVLDEGDALALLAQWAGVAARALPSEARAAADECGRLPFALALCGAMVRDGAPWADLLEALRGADLEFLTRQFPNYPYPDVLRALKVSVDALAQSDPEWARHYGELAVFPQGEAVPEAAVVQLWVYTDGLNERSARQLLTTLGRKSMLRLEGDAPHRRVSLHDLQHDYLRAALRDVTGLHGELLGAYREKCPEGWHTGPDDGYFHDHLAHHLAQAGRGDELHGLLLDYRWLRARLGASGPAPLVADYDTAIALPCPARALSLVQGALRLSAHVVGPDPSQLPSQLTGRLLGFGDSEIQALLEQARRETRVPWLRPLTPVLDAPGGPLMCTMGGHTEWVTAVALTPDGRLAVSASADRTLKVWDVARGQEQHTLAGHADGVTSVALAADGRLAVSGSADRTLKVWDVVGGRELRTLAGHTGPVTAVALTPDGWLAVSASGDRTLKVWDVSSGRELRTLSGHAEYVSAVALTSDGRRAISASRAEKLKVWEVESGKERYTLTGHTDWVTAVALTPDGRLAISGSAVDDATVKVWDLTSGRQLCTLTQYRDAVGAVALAANGREAVTASSARLQAWDLGSWKDPDSQAGHTTMAAAVVLTPDGRLAISGASDTMLAVWDLTLGVQLRAFAGHTGRVTAVALTPNGQVAVSASFDKTLRVWDVASGKELRTLVGHTFGVHEVALTADGQLAVSVSGNTLKVWDIGSGKELFTLPGHNSVGYAVALIQDGQLAVSEAGETLPTWDVASGKQLLARVGHTDLITAVALTPDGQLAVSASADKTLKVWDMASGMVLRTLEGHTHSVHTVVLTPEGQLAVSASGSELKVWEVASGMERWTLIGHTDTVTAAALTPDGQMAVSASCDKTLRVWKIASGKELRTLVGHTGSVTSVALTSDGRRVVSASSWESGDCTLKVWDLESGTVLAGFTSDSSGLMRLAVSGDGLFIVGNDWAGRAHFVRVENVTPGPAVVTAWRVPGSRHPAFGCPHCRTWSEIPESSLGAEIACPHCGAALRLNPFTIDADWRPVAKAWKGE